MCEECMRETRHAIVPAQTEQLTTSCLCQEEIVRFKEESKGRKQLK